MSEAGENAAWKALLEKYQDPFASAEEFPNMRLPPGVYTCAVKGVRRGSLKTGEPYWAVTATLLDQLVIDDKQVEGEDFRLAFFSMQPKREGFLKQFVKAVTGETINSLSDNDDVVRGTVGKVLRIEAVRSGEYTNYKVLEVLVETPAEGEQA